MLIKFITAVAQALQGGNFSSALPLTDVSNFFTTMMQKADTIMQGEINVKGVGPGALSIFAPVSSLPSAANNNEVGQTVSAAKAQQ